MRTPLPEAVETIRRGDDLIGIWICEICGEENEVGIERARTPWYCGSCGQIDRDVEAWFDQRRYAEEQEGPR